MKSVPAVKQAIYDKQAREAEIANERAHTFFMMLTAEAARRQYHQERKLSSELGFDLVDVGGEG